MKHSYEKLLGRFMHTKWLVIILLIGIGLLLLPNFLTEKKTSANDVQNVATVFNRQTYETELETRLVNILSTVRGISQVSVMVTLCDSGEIYYAQNETSDEKNTNDGISQELSFEVGGTLALKNDAGGGQSPILLKTQLPEVSGVLITAKGVDDPTIEADVVSAVRAVLDVATHRVKVLPKA